MDDRTPRGIPFQTHPHFLCLIVDWPIAKGIRRRESNPISNVALPVHAFDDKPNPATPGAPSEVGGEEFQIPK